MNLFSYPRLCLRRRSVPLLVLAISLLAALPLRAAPIDGYATYKTYRAQLDELDKSDLISLTVLAKTQTGREVVLITLSRGKPESKPAFLIVGNVHAPHIAGGEMALRLAKALVAKADDEKIKPLLDRFTFYIIPRPSPDATEAFFATPSVEREGNDRDTDDDRDGDTNEDGPDDLNGDGVITMMRITDPAGEWFEHPDDPRVLIKADPLKNEKGKYRLLTEGIDNDKDEQFNEDGPGGVSFNRNFTHQYPYFKPGAGPNQVSEPETRAIADFAFDRTNIAAVITFTPEDNLFQPWKPNPQADGARIKTVLHSADAPYQDFIAKSYRDAHGGKDAPPSPRGEGSFSEWAYFHYGRWSFASRGWWVPKVEEKKEEPKEGEKKEDKKKPSDEKRGGDEINALRWLAANKIDGFVEWKRIDHPDFKNQAVEVGGFKPFVLLNPPVAELEALTDKNLKWLGELSELMPKVAVSDVKIEALAANVFRVKATVMNTGYLPTMSEMGRITRQPLPLQLAIDLPKDATIIGGDPRTQLPVLKGNGGKHEHTWLIQAPTGGGARVKVWSASVGDHGKEIELKAGMTETSK
jgi:hypothetical protein